MEKTDTTNGTNVAAPFVPDGTNAGDLVCGCGSRLFRRVYPARGVWRQLIETKPGQSLVEVVETDTDGLREGQEPAWVRCAECGKRHPNPDFVI